MREGYIPQMNIYERISLMIKGDEMLLKLDNERPYLKPRPICNVHPEAQAALGPFIWKMQMEVKKFWHNDSDPHTIGDWKLYVYYASGCTDYDLSDWYQNFLRCSDKYAMWLAGSGDDSLVLIKVRNHTLIMEADGRMFDTSQGAGALDYALDTLFHFGLTTSVKEAIKKLYSAPYVAHARKKDTGGSLYVNHPYRPMLPTGFAGTPRS